MISPSAGLVLVVKVVAHVQHFQNVFRRVMHLCNYCSWTSTHAASADALPFCLGAGQAMSAQTDTACHHMMQFATGHGPRSFKPGSST